jgi:hypothetical protein
MRGDVFRPEVVVRGTDRPLMRLAVGIKTREDDLDEAARQLGRYMTGEACPLGMLVTPEKTHVYERTWSAPPESIEELAVVETPVLINARAVIEDSRELEQAVRQWLETLARNPGVPLHHEGEAARVEERLFPALVEAVVTAVGFR